MTYWNSFLIFPRKQVLTFPASWKKQNKRNITILWSAELAQSMVKVNHLSFLWFDRQNSHKQLSITSTNTVGHWRCSAWWFTSAQLRDKTFFLTYSCRGLFYLCSLNRSISSKRCVWLLFITIFYRNSCI